MQEVIALFNSSDIQGLVKTAVLLLLARFAIELVKIIISGTVTGIRYCQTWADTTAIGKITDLDNKFSAKLTEAVEAMMPLADDLKKLSSDGTLSKLDIEEIQKRAWELFSSSLGVNDLMSFGKLFISGFNTKSRDLAQDKVKARFLALLPKTVENAKLIKHTHKLQIAKAVSETKRLLGE